MVKYAPMQGFAYSIFSIVAIAVHLIINYDMLAHRRASSIRDGSYRAFLLAVMSYYVIDASWGIVAGFGWTRILYANTIFFFLSLCVFSLMWAKFVLVYLGIARWPTRIVAWLGWAILACNLVAIAVNPFCHALFYFDDAGVYHIGVLRNLAIYFLVGYHVLLLMAVFAKALKSKGAVRRRSMMVFMGGAAIAVAIVLQNIWPLTPVTSLGCLISNCVLHVFVVQDEQARANLAKLAHAIQRTRAAEKARGMFFSVVSHDIRTPLNAILGYTELLQSGAPNETVREEALRSIRASGNFLLQLVNDMLYLAKLDSGNIAMQPGPVDMVRLIDEVFASFRMSSAEKGVQLVAKAKGVPVLMLDELRFRQILFNLVGNAVKFTAGGSVTVAAAYDGANLELTVADTGCGIPADMMGQIMDPFMQIRDPSHADYRAVGTGFGLAICRRLVEVMGGELSVESEVGKGSTFKTRIPGVAVAKDEKPAAEKKVELPPPERLPKRVLVVDDSPVNRLVLSALLRKAGIDPVDVACDGEEAFVKIDGAAADGKPYDMVLTDYWMPSMNGLELAEKLRADTRFGHLPVFVVTADTEFRDNERRRLFTGLLLKPLTYGKLVATLAAHFA